MPSWSVYFEESASRDFRKLDRSIQIRITEKLDWFSNNFEHINNIIENIIGMNIIVITKLSINFP